MWVGVGVKLVKGCIICVISSNTSVYDMVVDSWHLAGRAELPWCTDVAAYVTRDFLGVCGVRNVFAPFSSSGGVRDPLGDCVLDHVLTGILMERS